MNRLGEKYTITILGSSHGEIVGVLIDGVPPNVRISQQAIKVWLDRRRPGQAKISTPRTESDSLVIQTGIFKGKTTGQPILAYVINKNVNSSSYEEIKDIPRPGHADFPSNVKYNGAQDYRGGGSFSGRMTIALIIAGAIAFQILNTVHIQFRAYTKEIAGNLVESIPSFESKELWEVYDNPTRIPQSKESAKFEELIPSKLLLF